MQNCSHCGAENWDTATRCIRCKNSLQADIPAVDYPPPQTAAKSPPAPPPASKPSPLGFAAMSMLDLMTFNLRFFFASLPALVMATIVVTIVAAFTLLALAGLLSYAMLDTMSESLRHGLGG